GSKDSTQSRWMGIQDGPAEGQLVKHPAVPPCHTHTWSVNFPTASTRPHTPNTSPLLYLV
ncbi:hypothetical protein KUCAC02_005006, partial [Chaenocephalus aceratus]